MQKLNPIQILDLQDLAKAQISSLYKTLEKSKCWRSKEITIREIARWEKSVKSLDAMFNIALVEEDEEFNEQLEKDLELLESK